MRCLLIIRSFYWILGLSLIIAEGYQYVIPHVIHNTTIVSEMPAVETTVEIKYSDIDAPPSIPEFNNLFTTGTIARRKRINSIKFEPGQFTWYTLSNRSMAYAFYLAMKADYC